MFVKWFGKVNSFDYYTHVLILKAGNKTDIVYILGDADAGTCDLFVYSQRIFLSVACCFLVG